MLHLDLERSYEKGAVSYEKFIISYEMILVSYESGFGSYEISYDSHKAPGVIRLNIVVQKRIMP
jgi:hypothetical protein